MPVRAGAALSGLAAFGDLARVAPGAALIGSFPAGFLNARPPVLQNIRAPSSRHPAPISVRRPSSTTWARRWRNRAAMRPKIRPYGFKTELEPEIWGPDTRDLSGKPPRAAAPRVGGKNNRGCHSPVPKSRRTTQERDPLAGRSGRERRDGVNFRRRRGERGQLDLEHRRGLQVLQRYALPTYSTHSAPRIVNPKNI